MRYEPIKASLNRFFKVTWLRRLFYFLLDLLLLRAWHVKRELGKIARMAPTDASALDAGSGLGQYVWRMVRMNPDWFVTGIDIIKEQVEDCTGFFDRLGLSNRVRFKEGDLTGQIGTQLYDLILSVDVMEHIQEDEKVFRNFFGALKPNGVLLISTPSDQGGSDAHDSHDDSFVDEHVRNGYSINDISGKLSAAGFSDISVKYTYGWVGQISWRLSMWLPMSLLNLSKLFFVLLPFYYLAVFPICLVLNWADLMVKHPSGTGLLVKAVKRV